MADIFTAGIALESVRGTKTSVHVGCMGNDYRDLLCKDIETSATYDDLGANVSMNANRVSWFFDLRGTSMNIDTACSSSLVALDLACQGLLNGDSNMVLSSFPPSSLTRETENSLTVTLGYCCRNKPLIIARYNVAFVQRLHVIARLQKL